MLNLLHDLRYATRILHKQPSFTLVAILTLALGIGANSAIFSVVDAVLLRPLPYHDGARLIDVFSSTSSGGRDELSVAEWQDLRAQMHSVEDLAALQSQSVNLTGGDRPTRVRGAFVSANFFKTFQLTPIVGRTFADGEDGPGGAKIVVINEKLWRERLNGDRDLEGKKLILNGEPYSVIGVVTSNFETPFDRDVQIWLGYTQYPGVTSATRDARYLIPVGYLKPGVPLAQAQAEANTIASQFAAAYPKESAGRGLRINPYREFLVGQIRPLLVLVFVAAGVILLIACANLANLLLARGLVRQREIAVRAALGASRGRLVRQLLTETTLLSLCGGIGGVLLAHWAVWGLLRLPQNFIRADNATVDLRVMFFALAVALITGWIFGLAPSLQLTRAGLQEGLQRGGRGAGAGAHGNRMRSAFVVAQIAFSIMLLIAAGLLIRSFGKLWQAGLGFDAKNLLTLEYRLPRAKYNEPNATWNFHRQVIDQVQQIPGVESGAIIRSLPFSGNSSTNAIALLDRDTPAAGLEPQADFNLVAAGYFNTARIPLLRGRGFNEQDRADTPKVFVINQTMAQRFWPNESPLGKQIKLLEDGTVGSIVGIVGDTKHYRLSDDFVPQFYADYAQYQTYFATLIVRTAAEPMTLAQQVQQAIWRVDPDQPMWKIRTVETLITRSVADRRFVLALMMVFAGLAALLTIIGLYGVISFLVRQRTPEIGIRMALGAQVHHILQLILKQGTTLVALGVVIGLSAAVVATRLMSHLLYGVSANDPLTFAVIGASLTFLALAACYFPARRASRVDPVIALRSE